MKLSAPTLVVWLIAVVFGVIGLVGHFTPIPYVSAYDYWCEVIGFGLLLLGTVFNGV